MSERTEMPPETTKFCTECGAEINRKAEICPECGVRQHTEPTSSGRELTDQYSPLVWVAALVIGLLTFPVGLLIPLYFYIKASGDEPVDQGGWEIAAVLLVGIFGILAVELGGEKGAKILFGIVIVFGILGMFLFFALLAGGAA